MTLSRLGSKLILTAGALALGISSSTMAQSISDVQKIAKERGLTTQDLVAAAKTYTPDRKSVV